MQIPLFRPVISTSDVVENSEIIAQIHLVKHEGQLGLLVCKRTRDPDDYPDNTYSIGRDNDGYLIMFYDHGEFIPATSFINNQE